MQTDCRHVGSRHVGSRHVGSRHVLLERLVNINMFYKVRYTLASGLTCVNCRGPLRVLHLAYY